MRTSERPTHMIRGGCCKQAELHHVTLGCMHAGLDGPPHCLAAARLTQEDYGIPSRPQPLAWQLRCLARLCAAAGTNCCKPPFSLPQQHPFTTSPGPCHTHNLIVCRATRTPRMPRNGMGRIHTVHCGEESQLPPPGLSQGLSQCSKPAAGHGQEDGPAFWVVLHTAIC